MTLDTPTANSTSSSRLQRRKARTRAAILEAATDLFTENGYEPTSIQQIADRADTGVGTVYGYFPSKEEILREVLRSTSDIAVERYHKVIQADTPSIERVCVAFRVFAEYVREHRSLLLAAIQSAGRRAPMDERILEWILKVYSSLIEEGIARGELRSVPVQAVVRTMVSAYTMATLGIGPWHDLENDPATEHDLESVVRALLEPAS